MPRILSPAYFHHYNSQVPLTPTEVDPEASHNLMMKQEGPQEKLKKGNDGEQLVLGLGPVQKSFWRLSRLVPLEGMIRQFNKFSRKHVDSLETSTKISAAPEDEVIEAQSLEIQEGSDGISLKPFSDKDKGSLDMTMSGKMMENNGKKGRDSRTWRRVPYLPSYVPFGQVCSGA